MTTKKTSRKTAKKSFPIWAWLLIAAAATALVFILFQQRASDSQQLPRTVSVEEAAALLEEGAFILDVREPSEWEQGHIEGATLIPLGQLLQRSAELPTDQTIVVVCRSGNRSAQGRFQGGYLDERWHERLAGAGLPGCHRAVTQPGLLNARDTITVSRSFLI